MRFGVISDVHGNIIALNEVLKEFEKRKVDKIICIGDIIGIGPRSEETVQKIIGFNDKLICVRGNHEGYLLDGIPDVVHNRPMREDEKEFHLWTQSTLSKTSKEFLSKLPFEQYVEIEGKKIYISHYPYEKNMIFKRHIFKPNIDECKELFSDIEADIYLFGHTHNKIYNEVEDKMYINPGALGCPCDSNKADCGILEIDKSKIHYEQIGIEYDKNITINQIEELKYPCYKSILQDFFGKKGD